jgi:hypothetical protein
MVSAHVLIMWVPVTTERCVLGCNIWRIAENILENHSPRAVEGWSSCFEVGRFTKCYRASDLDGIFVLLSSRSVFNSCKIKRNEIRAGVAQSV